jgi:hypothetical protein
VHERYKWICRKEAKRNEFETIEKTDIDINNDYIEKSLRTK